MTRKEAQDKAQSLEAMHPWIGDYEWAVRRADDGGWIVVKVAVQPDGSPLRMPPSELNGVQTGSNRDAPPPQTAP